MVKLVILETPFAAPAPEGVADNVDYARQCMRDCLLRGEAPMASHLLYTQPGVLSDLDKNERVIGIEAGLAWGRAAETTVVYTDRGISPGMYQGIDRAKSEGRQVEMRSIYEETF